MRNPTHKHRNIHLIGVPKKNQTAVLKCIEKSLSRATETLKYRRDIHVAILDAENWDIPPKMSALGQARINYITVKICFYRKGQNIRNITDLELPLTIQHEYSHVVRANTVGYPETLLDSFIDEGIACFVEYSAMTERIIPYIQNIKDERKIWQKAKRSISKRLTSELHNEWFFGAGTLPNWIGYRLGFLIVKQFMEKNPIGLDKLVRTSSKEILQKSEV